MSIRQIPPGVDSTFASEPQDRQRRHAWVTLRATLQIHRLRLAKYNICAPEYAFITIHPWETAFADRRCSCIPQIMFVLYRIGARTSSTKVRPRAGGMRFGRCNRLFGRIRGYGSARTPYNTRKKMAFSLRVGAFRGFPAPRTGATRPGTAVSVAPVAGPDMSVRIFRHAGGSVKRQLGDGGLGCCVWRYTSDGRCAIAKSFGLDAATRRCPGPRTMMPEGRPRHVRIAGRSNSFAGADVGLQWGGSRKRHAPVWTTKNL